jgi:thioredoxin-related protein
MNKKHLFALIAAFIALALQACQPQASDTTNKSGNQATNTNNAHFQGPVEWITIEQLEQKMKNEPRKVLVDLYTDWCGWCKRMDQSTFANPELAKYLNEKFYAVKFNAETATPVQFNGETYEAKSGGRKPTNMLTYKLILGDQTNGRVGYPTFAFLDEKLNRIDAFPGYKDAPTFDALSRFIAENHYTSFSFPQFQQTYKSSITATPAAPGKH